MHRNLQIYTLQKFQFAVLFSLQHTLQVRHYTPQPTLVPSHPSPFVFMFLLLLNFQSLSVEQDEGLEFFGDVSPVVKAVLDDGPGG